MKKLIKDGQVALLVSQGYGAGWSSWGKDDMVFEPVVAQMLIDNTVKEDILDYIEDKYPDFYTGGLDGLVVEWLPEGTPFKIDEYDGAESLSIAAFLTNIA